MRGSIHQKKSNGKYYPIVYLGKDEFTEKEKRKWGKGHEKLKDAEAELRKLLKDFDNDDIETGEVTFKYVYDIWIESVAPEQYKSDKSLSTAKSYYKCHIQPIWGKKKLSYIEPAQLQKYFLGLCSTKNNEKLAPQTKKKILSIMRSVFNLAIEYGFLNKSPADKVLIGPGGKMEYKTWSIEELNYFLELESVKNSPYYITILLALTCGLRRGEICGLQWKDYNNSSLFVQRGLDEFGKITRMKNASSIRRLELMSESIIALEEQKKKQEQWKKNDGYINSDFICTREDGSIIRPITVTENFNKFIKDNNDNNEYQLPKIRFHDLRHTFATISFENDINTKIVSEILGHSDTRTTQMIYQHVIPTMQKSAVTKLGNVIFKKPLEKPLEKRKKA